MGASRATSSNVHRSSGCSCIRVRPRPQTGCGRRDDVFTGKNAPTAPRVTHHRRLACVRPTRLRAIARPVVAAPMAASLASLAGSPVPPQTHTT